MITHYRYKIVKIHSPHSYFDKDTREWKPLNALAADGWRIVATYGAGGDMAWAVLEYDNWTLNLRKVFIPIIERAEVLVCRFCARFGLEY